MSSRILDSQVLGDELLFQVDLAPFETREFVILPATAFPGLPNPTQRTHARFVPERKDDFAWESDRIAFRVYGPALMTDPDDALTSSGVDVWVKSTRDLVVDKWYAKGDYHTDHGEGLDYYKVGPSRGCGGLGIMDRGNLFVSENYKEYRMVATGPIRSVFDLRFDTWDVNGRDVSEVRRVSIDAHSNFTRCESIFSSPSRAPLSVAVGIVRRPGGAVSDSEKEGWISYWEPDMPPNGQTGCAVILQDGVADSLTDGDHWLAIGPTKPGKSFVYFFGAGWSKSGDFPDASSWTTAVREKARSISSPIRVTAGK